MDILNLYIDYYKYNELICDLKQIKLFKIF